jgi:hypothetical protein
MGGYSNLGFEPDSLIFLPPFSPAGFSIMHICPQLATRPASTHNAPGACRYKCSCWSKRYTRRREIAQRLNAGLREIPGITPQFEHQIQLPIYDHLTDEQIEHMISGIRRAVMALNKS